MKRTWKKRIYLMISLVFWIGMWQYAAMTLDKSIFLPYPKDVWEALSTLIREESFGAIVLGSLQHIAQGFFLALLTGILLAILCSFSDFLDALLLPVLKLVKTVPVASFVILVLLWVDAARISIVISFLIVLPVVYENVHRGIGETNPALLEMCKVFRVSLLKRLRYIFLPTAIPYSTAACTVGLSLCWKAGIAAEIIGLSADSIGRQLYDAKLYLDTALLFAWTLIIVVVSVVFEWLVSSALRIVHVWLADNTLVHHPRRLIRFVLGASENRALSSSENEEQAEELAANAVAGNLSEQRTTGNVAGGDAPEVGATGEPDTEVTVLPAGEMLLALRNIHKSYDGKSILTDVSLTLQAGDVLLVRGASGCGKTTLLRILLGLTKPDSGERIFRDVKAVEFAAVFQEDRLCEAFSAYKNVSLVSELDAEVVCERLKQLGIVEPKKKPVREFSGGMKRRVAWERALSAPWDVLVLDEPFTGLDTGRTEQLLLRLKEERTGAIVIVTHSEAEVQKLRVHFPNMKEMLLGR